MMQLVKLLLIATVSTFTSAAPLPEELKEPVSGNPGAIFASLRLSSLNNIYQLMAPLLAGEILGNKSFNNVLHKSIAGVGINID